MKPRTISYNCKGGFHGACEGEAPKLEWNELRRPCKCRCHRPPDEEVMFGERRDGSRKNDNDHQ